MRSTCSTVASPSWHEPQRLEAERAVAAVHEEAGAVGGVDDVLAHRPAELARRLERGLAGVLARDDLDELHHRRRVEEVHADDALGARAPAAIAVTGSDDVLVASTQSLAHDLGRRPRTARA